MRRASPVAVTGLGCVSALGNDAPSCLAALDHARRLPPPAAPAGCLAGGTSPVFSCDIPEHADIPSIISRTVRLALSAAREALGSFSPSASTRRVGVCLGTSTGAALNFTRSWLALCAQSAVPPDEAARYFSSHHPALALARLCACKGPVQTVVNACSSGVDAIGTAAAWIREGLCDMALAGGADELSEMSYTGFCRLMIASADPCRPFDRDRRGLNLGEGAGILLLESADSRARRKAEAIGYVAGYGTACDAHHLTAPHPQAAGLRIALRQAMAQADTSGPFAFVNAHATATPTNDLIEGIALRELFPSTPVFAGKGATGHTLGAAGAVEAVFSLAHLARGLLPASPGFRNADPAIGLSPTLEPTFCRGNFALSQSLAFGGNNSVLLLRKEA